MRLYPQSFTGGADQTAVALGTTPPVAPVHRLARVANDHLSFMDVSRVEGAEWGKPPYTTNTFHGFAFSLNYTLQGGAQGVLPSPGEYYSLAAHGVAGHKIDDLWDGEPWLTDDLPYPPTPWTTLQVHTVLPGSEVNPHDHTPPADLTTPASYGSRGEYVLLKVEATLAVTLTDCTFINLHGRPTFWGDDRVFDWNHTFATPTTLPAGTVIRFFYPVAYREWAADRALTLPISEWGYWEGASEASNYVTVAAHNESVTGSMDAFSDWYIGYVPKYDLAVPFMTIDEDWGYPLWVDLRRSGGFDLTGNILGGSVQAGTEVIVKLRAWSPTSGDLALSGTHAASCALSLDEASWGGSVAIPQGVETDVFLRVAPTQSGELSASLAHPDGSTFSIQATAEAASVSIPLCDETVWPLASGSLAADVDMAALANAVDQAFGHIEAGGAFVGDATVASEDLSVSIPLCDETVWPLASGVVAACGVAVVAAVVADPTTVLKGPFRLELTSDDGDRLVIESDEQWRLVTSGE